MQQLMFARTAFGFYVTLFSYVLFRGIIHSLHLGMAGFQ